MDTTVEARSQIKLDLHDVLDATTKVLGKYVQWKLEEEARPWNWIKDTPEVRKEAIRQGAMFFTNTSFSEPYAGNNGRPEPIRYGDLYLDFDDKDNPENTLADARKLALIHLPEEFGVDPHEFSFFASGGKGLHLIIPARLFDSQDGDQYLPLIYKRMVADWKSRYGLPTVDMSIYNMSRGKMFRIENIKRSNGRYKVPLTLEEFRDLPWPEIAALTESPRNIDSIDWEVTENEDFSGLYRNTRWFVHEEIKAQQAEKKPPLSEEEIKRLSGNRPPCINSILTDFPKKSEHVNFNKIVVLLITFFQTAKIPREAATEQARLFIEGYTESDTYKTAADRMKHWAAMWDYLSGNPSYGFACRFALGFHLRGSAFDCKKCALKQDTKEQGQPEEWGEPISLDLSPLPTFDENDFPPVLWAMAEAVSDCLEVPTELPGLIAVAVAATAVQKIFEIMPEQGYTEPLNVYVHASLDSGNRKSSCLDKMVEPIITWERQEARRIGPKIKEATIKREGEDSRLNSLKQKFGKEGDPDKREKIQQEMIELSLNLTEVPAMPRLWTQDATPEKIAVMMSEQGERMAMFSAEGGIFETIGGRYSNSIPNIDIFLQGHSGDAVRVDRLGRPSITLERPALTMAISAQPDVLRSIAGKPGFRGLGFLARFLYALPESRLGHRTLEPRPVPEWISGEYNKVVLALLNKPLDAWADTITLDPEAHRLWKAFAREVEKDLADGGRFEFVRDWAGKLPGAVARIAGIFHCVMHAEDKPEEIKVHPETMIMALNLSRKLTEHALAVFDLMGLDPEIEGARKVLEWIRRKKEPFFTGRDCHHALCHTFAKKSDLDPILDLLMDRGYIRKGESEKSPKGGRPSEMWEVNPAALKSGVV